jgi:ATP synthase protein I
MSDRPDDEGGSPEKRFRDQVDRKVRRRLGRRREHDVWFWLGMFGLVGWSVAIPTLLGIALGVWLDREFPAEHSWTLTFLFIGIVLGCLNAWYWVRQESRGS